MSDGSFLRLLPVLDIANGGYVMAKIGAYDVLVCRLGAEVFAIEDRCSHMAKPLNGGYLTGCRITCPEHGAEFDVRTGAAVCFPASRPVRRFNVRVSDGFVEVESAPVPEAEPAMGRPFGI